MANKQISQLTAKPSPVASTDQFGIDDNSSDSWKITVANLQTYFSSLYLLLSGGTLTGNLLLVGDPTSNLMAATKQYVDAVATGLNIQPACRAATTATLTAAYNNGASGVGATLTNSGAMAAFSVDGYSAALNDRILVKNQSSSLQNGIYTVTTVGSGAVNWVLTRATDFDTIAEIQPGDFVLVLSGTTNAQTQWVQTATVATIGTDAITWEQFSGDITILIPNIQNNAYVYSEDTGAADAYVATLTPAPAAYTEGMLVILDIANANTGASTINVNSLGLKNIVTEQNGSLVAGDLIANRRAWLLYDGTSFRLVNRNIEKRIQNESFSYVADSGTANAYAATLVPAATSYVAGLRVSLKIANSNTGASTLNVNAIGATNILLENGDALVGGELQAGMMADLRYDGSAFQLLNPANILSLNGNPNLLINGGFLMSQRGSTFTAASPIVNNDDVYTLDQWVLLSDGNDTLDVSQEATVVPTGSFNSIKLDVETANRKAGILNIVEARNAKRIIGGVASLSFKAQKVVGNATVDKLRAAVISWSSTADSVTSDVVSAWGAEGADPTLVANWTYENTPSDLTLTDSWQTFRIPNISIDTASTANVAVFIWIDNTDGTVGDLVYIADVKLEAGESCTPYPVELMSKVKQDCLRSCYVANTTTGNDFFMGLWTSTTKFNGTLQFPVPMRITPSVTYLGTTSNFRMVQGGGGTANASSVSGGAVGTDGYESDWDTGTATTAGWTGIGRVASDAQLVFSADL